MPELDDSLSAEPLLRAPDQPFRLFLPKNAWAAPIIVTVTHSGRYYPPAFLQSSRLDIDHLRLSEDAYIDLLVGILPHVPLLNALPARLYVDLNRDERELDPLLFAEELPVDSISTARVHAGLGVVPRLATGGSEIYRQKLTLVEACHRIEIYHRPFHAQLATLVEIAKAQFGHCIIFDCHSMPSSLRQAGDADIVLGDCFGSSCASTLVDFVEQHFSPSGVVIARNTPYSGGYVTQHYGLPRQGQHVVQIEINRRLYMDEQTLRLRPGFVTMQKHLEDLWKKATACWSQIVKG